MHLYHHAVPIFSFSYTRVKDLRSSNVGNSMLQAQGQTETEKAKVELALVLRLTLLFLGKYTFCCPFFSRWTQGAFRLSASEGNCTTGLFLALIFSLRDWPLVLLSLLRADGHSVCRHVRQSNKPLLCVWFLCVLRVQFHFCTRGFLQHIG